MAKTPTKPDNDVSETAKTGDEPKFPYALELVATIAVHFADGNVSDSAAVTRAIKLLDVVTSTIEARNIELQARAGGKRQWDAASEIAVHVESPENLPPDADPYIVPFLEGIRYCMDQSREENAIRDFRNYLRINLRRAALSKTPNWKPRNLTVEQLRALLQPADAEQEEAEVASIEKLITRYRREEFSRSDVISIKQDWEHLKPLLRSFRSAAAGKMGGRGKIKKSV